MKVREINNIGQPMTGPDGTPLGGVEIEWLLCDAAGMPAGAIDVETRSVVTPVPAYSTTSATNVDGGLQVGEFRCSGLWPTTRASNQVFYRCRVSLDGWPVVIAPISDLEGPLKWSDFIAGNAV